MNPDSTATQIPTRRRFVSITRTVHPSGDGYNLDAVANDGTAWHRRWSPYIATGWEQHPPLPPIS